MQRWRGAPTKWAAASAESPSSPFDHDQARFDPRDQVEQTGQPSPRVARGTRPATSGGPRRCGATPPASGPSSVYSWLTDEEGRVTCSGKCHPVAVVCFAPLADRGRRAVSELPQIDGYSALTLIARGGFGIVYRARQDRHGRLVALKVLNVESLDDRSRQRFERECIAMGSLSWHPNVVALHDSGITSDGRPWLAMEYLEAGSLADRLAQRPVSVQEAMHIGVQVAGALAAAHTTGTLHRDVKPENVLIGLFDEAKIGDFGIAAIEGSTRTTAGHGSFTLAHVAPEILRGQRPDERADVYSLATTLHTLVAGAPPFAGDPDEAFASLMARILTVPAPHLEAVPIGFADLVQCTLAKDPRDRPQSAEEFGRALQRIQSQQGLPVTDLVAAPGPATSRPGGGLVPTVPRGPDRPGSSGDALPTIVSARTNPSRESTPGGTNPPPPPPANDRHRSRRLVVALVCLVGVLALGLAVAVGAILGAGDSNEAAPQTTLVDASTPDATPATQPTTSTALDRASNTTPTSIAEAAIAPVVLLNPASVTATESLRDQVVECEGTVTHGPTNMFDGIPATAWSTDGDGTGEIVTVDLGSEFQITQVGIVPGYDKVGGCDQSDRFAANGRVTEVTWRFDDGTESTQQFEDSHDLQTLAVDAHTQVVRMEIVGTVPGSRFSDTVVSSMEIRGRSNG